MADDRQSERINEVLQRLVETHGGLDVEYMTEALKANLMQSFAATQSLTLMQMLEQGIELTKARTLIEHYWPVYAFQIGLLVGQELEAGRALREMFGEE